MRGMNQLRQVKKSIAWKSGVVARSLTSGGWHRFMDHSAQSKKIFQQTSHHAAPEPGSFGILVRDAGA